MGRAKPLSLVPVGVECRVDAVSLGAAAVALLVVPPLVADGRRILFWDDVVLVALSLFAVVWLRRVRRWYSAAPPVPVGALFLPTRSVIRRAAMWGTPYLLFALAGALANPDFFGFGFAIGLLAISLALEARHLSRWERLAGCELYRRKGGGKGALYRKP